MPAAAAPHPNRLTLTLVMLVGSMTVGAGVLNWLHDLTAPGATARNTLMGKAAAGPHWRTVSIRSLSDRDATPPFHHFFIDRDGHEHTNVAWTRSTYDSATPGAVCVLIEETPGETGPSRRQWETLVYRIRELQTQFGIAARDVQIDVHPNAQDSDNGERAAQLSRMMQTAGLVG